MVTFGAKQIEELKYRLQNEKERQTYYGAINYRTGKVILEEYQAGNTENTISFIKNLLKENQGAQIVIIWDGAKYHHSQEFKEYLEVVNEGKSETEWLVKCIKLAPNAPEQNPIEDVWLQGFINGTEVLASLPKF